MGSLGKVQLIRLAGGAPGIAEFMGVDYGPNGRARQLSLPPEPASQRAAREFVRAACGDWSVHKDICDDAELVATELVANVVDHALTSCVLTVSRDGTQLRIDVEDLCPSSIPAPEPADLSALRGRGLQVIAAVSAAWGVQVLLDRKSVWAVLGDY